VAEAAPTADAGVVDEARSAAAGTRSAARWLASALAAIPSLAIVTTLVSGPGDAGFREGRLIWGVALAALGALIGVISFAGVFAPVPLTDKDLARADLRSIPGSRYPSFPVLAKAIEALRDASVLREGELSEAEADAKKAESQAAAAEAYATTLEADAKDGDDALKERAKKARAEADAKRLVSQDAAGSFAALTARSKFLFDQLERAKSLRHEAYLLKAADVVGAKYSTAQAGAVVATILIAAGVAFLALAPKPKPKADTAAAVSLVTLSPNELGMKKLGCEQKEVSALRIGGEESAPKVITFPSAACPSRVIAFTKENPSLGQAREVKQVDPSP
jgi:hypothetical protein